MAANHKKSRYPGIRAFERNERHVFFGRRLEARKLFNMVKAKPLVVLFAKSGIGKSSLINAGVEPLLEKDYFQVIKVRLQTTAVSPIDLVKNELSSYVDQSKLDQHAKQEGLWEYLKACSFKKGEEEVTPVLVFDQFEEFFEHDSKDQLALNQELADMVSDRLPERIRASLRTISFRERTQEQLDWHSPIPVKIIFAIRSDRMSLMDDMSRKIPSILHHRFHLKPLGIAAAREAIVEPARCPGDQVLASPRRIKPLSRCTMSLSTCPGCLFFRNSSTCDSNWSIRSELTLNSRQKSAANSAKRIASWSNTAILPEVW